MPRIELRGGILKTRIHGRWVRYDPVDDRILREAEAVQRFRDLGLSSPRSVEGHRAKAGGQDEKNESNRERIINNELYRRYTL